MENKSKLMVKLLNDKKVQDFKNQEQSYTSHDEYNQLSVLDFDLKRSKKMKFLLNSLQDKNINNYKENSV